MNSRLLIVSGLLAVAFSGTVFAKTKPEPPRQTYLKSRLINRSCQAVWSAAMPIMTETGFTPQTLERESGVASFGFNKTSGGAYSTNDAKLYTTAPVGFLTRYAVFGIQSATMTVSPEVGACTCQIAINFVGFQQAWSGSGATAGHAGSPS
jgi:hypothetical protein